MSVEHQHPPVRITATSSQLMQAAGYRGDSEARVTNDCLRTGAAPSCGSFRRGSGGLPTALSRRGTTSAPRRTPEPRPEDGAALAPRRGAPQVAPPRPQPRPARGMEGAAAGLVPGRGSGETLSGGGSGGRGHEL